ncbi:hypothetical protein NPIL_666021 [Nephila pilipes]|uniref:Uncharacterized protein n=1 Tax=Nephila pilipes TaxID=299642 RepID=A0A8X6PCV6_NEPPI|nr:hypothetical protein NPIL_666021 [Nephila pilipes]
MEVPRQSSSRGPIACFWSTNRKQNTLLLAPKENGAYRQLPTPPDEIQIPSMLLQRNKLSDSESKIVPQPDMRLCANKAENAHLC